MHELHLAQDVWEKIKAEARARKVMRARYAKVKIGQALITDPTEFAEIFADIAGGMKLDYEIVPLGAVCGNCGKGFDSPIPRLDCPACGSTNIRISSGRELIIDGLK